MRRQALPCTAVYRWIDFFKDGGDSVESSYSPGQSEEARDKENEKSETSLGYRQTSDMC